MPASAPTTSIIAASRAVSSSPSERDAAMSRASRLNWRTTSHLHPHETGEGAFRALRADEFLGTERGRVDKCWPLHSPADWGRHAPDYGNGKYEESLTTPIRADIDASLVAQL